MQGRRPEQESYSHRIVGWCLIGFLLCALVAWATADGQVTASASLVRYGTSSDHQSRDREAVGLRYRTPSLAGVTLQAGTLLTAENGLLEPSDGAGIRHWAVGAEYLVTTHLRAQLEYGNFDEIRASGTSLPSFTYYRFVALGSELTLGHTVIMVEKLLSATHQTHAGIHDLVLQAHGEWFDLMASTLHQSADQAPYHLLTAEATVRPFPHWPTPFNAIGIEGGTRALPSMTDDRESLVPFVGAGFFFHFIG